MTQHPTTETRDAFWSMLWDHNAQTVVLLTPVDTQVSQKVSRTLLISSVLQMGVGGDWVMPSPEPPMVGASALIAYIASLIA